MYTIHLSPNDAKIVEDAVRVLSPERFNGVTAALSKGVRYITGADNEEQKRYLTKLRAEQLLPHLDLNQCDLHLIDSGDELFSSLQSLPKSYNGYVFYTNFIYFVSPEKGAVEIADLNLEQSQQFNEMCLRLQNKVGSTHIAWQEDLELIHSITKHQFEPSSLNVTIGNESPTGIVKGSELLEIETENLQKNIQLLPATSSLFVANNTCKNALDVLHANRDTMLFGADRDKKVLLKEANKFISWFWFKYSNESLIKKIDNEITKESAKGIDTINQANSNYVLLLQLYANDLSSKPQQDAINGLLSAYDSAYSQATTFYECLELTNLLAQTNSILANDEPQKSRQLNLLLEPFLTKAEDNWQRASLAEKNRSSLLFKKVITWLVLTIAALSLSIIFYPEALLLASIGALSVMTLPTMAVDKKLAFYEQSNKLGQIFSDNLDTLSQSNSPIITHNIGGDHFPPPAYQVRPELSEQPFAPPSYDFGANARSQAYNNQNFSGNEKGINFFQQPAYINGLPSSMQPSAPPLDEVDNSTPPYSYN